MPGGIASRGVRNWNRFVESRGCKRSVSECIGCTSTSDRRSPGGSWGDYDSTIGYNETVGYRAGTSQAYKPLQSTRLIELPLHIMDTALFFPAHLDLSTREASKLVAVSLTTRFGLEAVSQSTGMTEASHPKDAGVISTLDVVDETQEQRCLVRNRRDTVAWFRKRRSATFERPDGDSETVLRTALEEAPKLPGLLVRIHNLREQCNVPAEISPTSPREFCLVEGMHVHLPLNAEDDNPPVHDAEALQL